MIKKKCSQQIVSQSLLIISNIEFIAWKEKIIQRKQKEQAVYKNLDEYTETFEFKPPEKASLVSTPESTNLIDLSQLKKSQVMCSQLIYLSKLYLKNS